MIRSLSCGFVRCIVSLSRDAHLKWVWCVISQGNLQPKKPSIADIVAELKKQQNNMYDKDTAEDTNSFRSAHSMLSAIDGKCWHTMGKAKIPFVCHVNMTTNANDK